MGEADLAGQVEGQSGAPVAGDAFAEEGRGAVGFLFESLLLLLLLEGLEGAVADDLATLLHYALVMQATRDGIFDSNLATGASYHSPRFNEILGYGEYELPTGQSSFFDQVHPDDRPRLIENAARNDADKSVQSFEHEVRARCKDGSYRWVATNGRLLRDADGKPVRVVGAIRDITKRREAEEKLAASEKRLRDIVDSLYGFVGLYTLDGVLDRHQPRPARWRPD